MIDDFQATETHRDRQQIQSRRVTEDGKKPARSKDTLDRPPHRGAGQLCVPHLAGEPSRPRRHRATARHPLTQHLLGFPASGEAVRRVCDDGINGLTLQGGEHPLSFTSMQIDLEVHPPYKAGALIIMMKR